MPDLSHKLTTYKQEVSPDDSKLEFLASFLYGFNTYDSEMDELLALKALEVCEAISIHTTSEYIEKSNDNYQWFLIILQTTFFSDKLDWGTSIRNPWWDINDNSFLKMLELESEIRIKEWSEFCVGLVEWVKE